MTERKARVLTEEQASGMSVIVPAEGLSPAISGPGGGGDIVCGSCALLLVEEVGDTGFEGIAVKCWRCGAVNALENPPAH